MSNSCGNSCSNMLQDGEKPTIYYKMRFWVFGVITLMSLIIPWIKINGNHIFLLSFDHKQLHLMGVAFDTQEFYLMPFLLMFLFLFVFFITVLGGRVWCGWACPQTIFRVIYRDLIQGGLLGMRKRKNKQKEPKGDFVKRAVAIVIWSILAFIAASNFTWYFVPPEDYLAYLQNPAEHPVLVGIIAIITGFLIYDVIKLKEDFCGYICPYVRVQSALYDHDTVYTIYDEKRGGKVFDGDTKLWKKPPNEEDECIGCEACVTVCPTHIDIRKGMQLECINCLECSDACANVMGELGKKSLINWESNRSYYDKEPTRFFRFKILGYLGIMTAVLVALFYMGSNKEGMLLNINKSNKIYTIKDDIVTNDYIFLFTNTDNKKHQYFFEIEGHENIKVIRPKSPFTVMADQKLKKIVVLGTEKAIGNNTDTYTKIPLKIRAFALDNEKEITVFRNTVFIYPPTKEVK